VRPVEIAVASERIRLALAQLEQAQVLWLPTLSTGVDYFRHDGRIQDVQGNLFDTSKSTLMVGTGPVAVFALSDAIFAPLAARQITRAQEAGLQVARNDSLLAVAEAYFNVQQARGELAGAQDAAARADDLIRRTLLLGKGAAGLASDVEVVRVKTEAARRRQTVEIARERWRVASAELVRILRLETTALVEPLEPPHLQVTLVPLDRPVDDLIPVALTNRPELAEQQAIVQANLQRLRQERIRPLVPSILLRGASTNPAGILAAGSFGGGKNDFVSNFGARSDFDVEILWELQNLGFRNLALVKQRRSEHELSWLELYRIQDRVAAEVIQAYAQAQSAAARLRESESELKDAVESANKNREGLSQPRFGAGNITLIIRPQEAVAAVQALGQAYTDYYGAVGDYDRAQFRLYRALGYSAQGLADPNPNGCAPSGSCSPLPSVETAPLPSTPAPASMP
jgi:outer membrane protein TolC